MKKLSKFIVPIFLMLVLMVITVGLASADGGPHGGYDATTDACAGCHRAHRATAPKLLVLASDALCYTCHGSVAAGADTNVVDGVLGYYDGDDTNDPSASNGGPDTTKAGVAGTPTNANALNGGGFLYALDPSDGVGFVQTTSRHTLGATQAWGGATGNIGVLVDLASAPDPLSCTSCHDPHGNNNYRIINTDVNGVTGVSVPQVDEGTSKDYTVEDWAYGDNTSTSSTGSISQLCAACHNAYHVGGALAHDVDMSWDDQGPLHPETDGLGGFYLPLANNLAADPDVIDDIVLCTTCHLPHGSSAFMATNSEAATLDEDPTSSGTEESSSALLRLDNRGVCQVCHQK